MKLARAKKKKEKVVEEVTEAPVEEKPKYANLKEVIDYTRPFELIFSGVENDSYYNILYDMGVRNFLMSYHYIQTKHINMRERFEGQNVRLFIDSGAHTYQNDPKYVDYDEDYWEKHLQKYLRWVERNKDYIFAIASFDYENLVSPLTVERWNREYLEPFMLRTGIPVCFVWHQDSSQDWDFYCKRYPYVGFSSVNTEGVAIDLNEYRNRLRTAEKYDAVVHGFGMTRTAMLTELPFYTSDSTTWLVGLQYGELNYWNLNTNKMSRLKKDAWQTDFLDEICGRYSLDRDKMLEEDVTEVVKANVGAFQDAENYIQTRLVSRMYWMKSKAQKNDLEDMSLYPTIEQLEDSSFDLATFASKMNINPELGNETGMLVFYATLFINRNKRDYRDMFNDCVVNQEGVSVDLHNKFINRIVPDEETRLQDLEDFFRECVSGENDLLLQYGTNFDRVLRERDRYIEDEDEYDTVDVSAEEVSTRIQALLPSPDDVDKDTEALDKEIYDMTGITPIRNEKGQLLKGQKQVKRPKLLYSKKFPKFACDTCYAAQKCPEYKAGYVCAYQRMFKRFDTRDKNDIISALQGIVEHNLTRMQKAMIMETMNGTIDPVVSQLMDTNVRYMDMLNRMYESQALLQQTRTVRADGSYEETTSVNAAVGGPSIMETLLSKMLQPSKSEEPEDVENYSKSGKQKNERYNVDPDEIYP